MEPLAAAGFLSLVANRIIEVFVRPIKENVVSEDFSWWWLVYVSWILGGVLAWLAGLQLFAEYFPDFPLVDRALTAFVVGGGANLLNVFDE